MKKLIVFALLLLSYSGFGQSVTINELIEIFNNTDAQNNTLLVDGKGFEIAGKIPDGGHFIINYQKDKGWQQEQNIATGMGFYKDAKTFEPNLYYKATDTLYVKNLMKQLDGTDYKLDNKGVNEGVSYYNFSNDVFWFRFTFSSRVNMITIFKK